MKRMSPKAFYYTIGKKNFFQYILFGIFILFFYMPLMNLCMLAFADKYEVPVIIPQKFGFRWWEFVLGQGSLLSSIATSFVLAVIVTAVSLLICIPAAYALARFNFKGKRIFLLSFLLSNAYPRMGLYISIGILFYRLNLMGTFCRSGYHPCIEFHDVYDMDSVRSFQGSLQAAGGICQRCRSGTTENLFLYHTSSGHAGYCSCKCVYISGFFGRGTGDAAGRFPSDKNHASRTLWGYHGISADSRAGAVSDFDYPYNTDFVCYEKIHQCR